MSSLAELRKELKEIRKSAMPTPVSRMKKTDVAREIDRLKGIHRVEEKASKVEHVAEVAAVKKVAEKAGVPKKVVEKVVKVEKTAHVKQEKAEKVAHKAEEKAVKGSQAAKDKMAAIRAMRKSKADE